MRTRILAALGLATVALAVLVPSTAGAFHHAFIPGAVCGVSDFSGGGNPTATAALREHNPAQTLPLPPVGTPANPDGTRVTDCPGAPHK